MCVRLLTAVNHHSKFPLYTFVLIETSPRHINASKNDYIMSVTLASDNAVLSYIDDLLQHERLYVDDNPFSLRQINNRVMTITICSLVRGR